MLFSNLFVSFAVIAIVSSYIKNPKAESDLLLKKSGSVNLSAACDFPSQTNKKQSAEVLVHFPIRGQCQVGSQQRSCCPLNSTKYEITGIALLKVEKKIRAGVKRNALKKQWEETEKLKEPRMLTAECGKQLVNRIYGGEIAELDEYPWMALLVYNSNEYGCAGVLISRRFVLTAAHCVFGVVFEEKKGLKAVRLGEYNTNTEPDCIQEISHIVCADSALDVGVEKVLVHPKYDETSRDMQNDIALLRLEQDIQFTHFIMPICLPSTGTNVTLFKGTIFTVAGWGRTNLCKCFTF